MNQLIKSSEFETFIFEFRGHKVMIDKDIATLYKTETKKLKQAINRNKDRFPEDFMFQLNREEKSFLINNVKRLNDLKFSKIEPYAFTEQGVAMLSSILNSKEAIRINMEIMRSFVQYRYLISNNKELQSNIKALDKKIDDVFKYLIKRIDDLSPSTKPKRKPIGFKQNKK